MEKLTIEEIEKLYLFIAKTKSVNSEEYNILSRLNSNYQETLKEADVLTASLLNHSLSSLDTKFISQLFEEHQTQQERIAEERNKVIESAAVKITRCLKNIDTSLERLRSD